MAMTSASISYGSNQLGGVGQGYNDCPSAALPKVTAFDHLASGVSEVKRIEHRLFNLMDKLVGVPSEACATPYPPREPGLLGDVGEAGRDLSRTADTMDQYLSAIERALP